ncbi:hypothetical protein NJB1907f34b_24200 [Mycobacterium marinum]|nr:hypothetical protein NJB1907f34b_24200 [Mycobacterium marinum]GJO21476.1 hypothetical protein NJB1907E11_30430 [Mycobacterium marinum]GJO41453.1 hypothetical protein NJB1604_13590 [Mycobacterium marinum]GJO67240.1 hypothetical protein NJB1907E39_42020 [Mycobacterium marinum]GJO99439.1 hypothetical protein NJB18001_13420 [Mycobacterium marinum]
MLASSDRVAMTPTAQPAAAGTQSYREMCLPCTERGFVTVTDREDIPYEPENPGEVAAESYRPGARGSAAG